MSLRKGVTFHEEQKVKAAIKAGEPWSEVKKLLQDCDLDYVKEHLFDPMAASAEADAIAAEADKPKTEKKKKKDGDAE